MSAALFTVAQSHFVCRQQSFIVNLILFTWIAFPFFLHAVITVGGLAPVWKQYAFEWVISCWTSTTVRSVTSFWEEFDKSSYETEKKKKEKSDSFVKYRSFPQVVCISGETVNVCSTDAKYKLLSPSII